VVGAWTGRTEELGSPTDNRQPNCIRQIHGCSWRRGL